MGFMSARSFRQIATSAETLLKTFNLVASVPTNLQIEMKRPKKK